MSETSKTINNLIAEKHYTVAEVAEICRRTPYTVREWIKTGKLKATKPGGGHFRVSESDLKTFLNERASNA